MRAIPTALARLARSFDTGVATRVRTVRKSDGWTVDLTDLCDANWVRGVSYAEDLENNTVTFTVSLLKSIGENTLSPFRRSKANRNGTTAEPVLAVKRLVIVDVQVLPPEGIANPDLWTELTRGYVDRISVGGDSITLECRDESARFIDRWQEYERNWPETIPQALEGVLQALLDTATYDPGPWIAGVARVVGDLARPTTHNGHLYRCTTAGTSHASTEPTWNLTPGATTTDGTATWTNVGAMPAAAWTTAATARLGQLVRPTTRNGYMYQCTVAGTTGGAKPTWPTAYAGTVVDGTATWALIEDFPDVYTPVSPSWSVTRASADDYGLPPQSYWDIVRAFVDQIGWDFRFAWDSTAGRRRPRLRSVDDGAEYNQNGDAGTFDADQYEMLSDVELAGESVRNVVEVVYFDGDETGTRTKTVLRVRDAESIAAYGVQFCQLNLDSAGLINSATEAERLAYYALQSLKRPVMTFSIRVPFMPWIEPGDGLKLTPRPEDAWFDGTDLSGTALVAVVQGLSHRTDDGSGSTELQLRASFIPSADDTGLGQPLNVGKFLASEVRARVGKAPTFNRPGDVVAHVYGNTTTPIAGAVKPGTLIPAATVHRDIGGNTSASTFEAPVDGLYAFTASFVVPNGLVPGLEVWLTVVADGSSVGGDKMTIGTAGTGGALTASGTAYMTRGSSMQMFLATDPATSITPTAGVGRTFLHARLVR